MPEYFQTDPEAMQAFAQALEQSRTASRETTDNMRELQAVMNDMVSTKSSLSEGDVLSGDSLDVAKGLQSHLESLGVPLSNIKKLQSDINKLKAAESGKTAAAQNNLKNEEGIIDGIKDAFEEIENTLKSTAQRLTGVQFSLMGIVELILEINNESRKISGYSKQIEAQWGQQNKQFKRGSGLMHELRGNFAAAFEEAGDFLTTMSRAGMEQEHMNKVASEMVAIQHVQGVSVNEQIDSMKNLVNNLELSSDAAQGQLVALRESARTLDKDIMMSMQDYVSGWESIVERNRVYNTNLLETTAFYNTLIKKADDIGLGNMPVELRQELSAVVGGFSTELEDGWKAALGEGKTVAQRIIDFEAMSIPEKFESFAKFINEKMGEVTDENVATQQIKVRELVKQFGFTTKEMQKVLGEAFTEGAFNKESLNKVMQEMAKQKQDAEALEARAGTIRERLLKQGSAVARQLQSLEEIINKAIKDWLRPIVNDLITAIRDLVSAIKEFIGYLPDFSGKGHIQRLADKEIERRKTQAELKRIAAEAEAERGLGQISAHNKLQEDLGASPYVSRLIQEYKEQAEEKGGFIGEELREIAGYRARGRAAGLLDPEQVKRLIEIYKDKGKSEAIEYFNSQMKKMESKVRALMKIPGNIKTRKGAD